MKSWLEGREVALARLIARVSSFPEKSLAEAASSNVRQGESCWLAPTPPNRSQRWVWPWTRVVYQPTILMCDPRRGNSNHLRRKCSPMTEPRLATIAEQSTPDEFARTVRDEARRLERR